MIYAIGLDSDQTFRYFLDQTASRGIQIQAINLRAVITAGWRLAIPDDGSSWVEQEGERLKLDPSASYFCRVIDLSTANERASDAIRWRSLTAALNSWLEHIPGTVINRPGKYTGDNSSKPLHEIHLARLGFAVPASLTSSNRTELASFASSHPTIVKTISGVRANARLVAPQEFQDFDRRQGPVHLQSYVAGADVRAHVNGGRIHAEYIQAEAVDYRQSAAGSRQTSPFNFEASLAEQIIRATAEIGLEFAGWDFKIGQDGKIWCLEANPMPGYDGYDRRLGGAITESLLVRLGAVRSTSLDGENWLF